MKSCLIIEDQIDCQHWLKHIVSAAFPDCEIHLAANQTRARILITEHSFELAIIDLALPDGCGLEIVRALKRIAPQTKSVIMTAMGEDAKIVAALSAGAQGYLLKESPADQVSRQLRELNTGLPALSPSIARRIMEHFQHTGPIQTQDQPLTKRERETLLLISRGYRNHEVAEQLGIAPTTVASHIKSIYKKLGISTRAEASWFATRLGL